MGKTLVSKYPNVLKSSIKIRVKKPTSKLDSEKAELKRRKFGIAQNEPPPKKIKVDDESGPELNIATNYVADQNAERNEIVLKSRGNYYLQTKDSDTGDLFFDDEFKTTYFKNCLRDLYLNIVEEISLEGLDGITLEGK